MYEKILWICPTRNRPEKLQRLIDSWREQSEGLSVLLIAIDDDDRSNDSLILRNQDENIIWEIGPRINGAFLHLLNKLAVKYSDQYKYIGFMEDDCVFKTKYESRFIEKLNELGPLGFCHADDKINAPRIVSLPCLRNEIIKKLGWFSPPQIKCLWMDYYFRLAASHGLKEYYFPDIVIQHLHYSVEDNIRDETAQIMEAAAQPDYPNYHKYIEKEFFDDMKKLKI